MPGQKRVLIVDDTRPNTLVLRRLLERVGGYEVSEARDAAETYAQVSSETDIVLLDVNLPDESGVDVCRKLKANPKTQHIPILLISAVRTDDESIREGLDAGADGYLIRPIDPVALRAWLGAALKISELQRALHAGEPAAPADHAALMERFRGISHDINNPLQSILAALDLLGMDLENDPEAMDNINRATEAAEQIARLAAKVSQLARSAGD